MNNNSKGTGLSSSSGSPNFKRQSSAKQSANKPKTKNSSLQSAYQTFILSDFRAVSYLKRDLDLLVDQGFASYEPIEIQGYEFYIVEQWILERKIGTIITTFTGNSNHIIQAVQLTILKNQSYWPSKFKKYLSELIKFQHAKPKEFKNNGLLFVTNLSSFYSDNNLNIIHIDPIYDKKIIDLKNNQNNKSRFKNTIDSSIIPFPKNYQYFEVNFNLKRLGCGGRSGLLFAPPPKASEDKFNSMYKISENVPILYSVKELVMLVQISLYYFDSINPAYCDGVLCNKTQEAITKWWKTIGQPCLGTTSQDGKILGPKTVAAIFSVLISCKLRLNLITSDNSKDPYDIISFKMAIYNFQRNSCKSNDPSWLLDPMTFNKLISITNEKLRDDNLLKLKKVVNKTVNDISRKSNKINNVSIETFNIDEMKLNLHGKRLEYLFFGKGKPHKSSNVLLDIYYSQKKFISKPDNKLLEHLNSELATNIPTNNQTSNDGSIEHIDNNHIRNSEETEQGFEQEIDNKTKSTNKFDKDNGPLNKSDDSVNVHNNISNNNPFYDARTYDVDLNFSFNNNKNESLLSPTSNDQFVTPKFNFSQKAEIFSDDSTNLSMQPANGTTSTPFAMPYDEYFQTEQPHETEEITSPSKLTSATNYMHAIKNVANQRKQKINDSINQVSKAAIKGLNQSTKSVNSSSAPPRTYSSSKLNSLNDAVSNAVMERPYNDTIDNNVLEHDEVVTSPTNVSANIIIDNNHSHKHLHRHHYHHHHNHPSNSISSPRISKIDEYHHQSPNSNPLRSGVGKFKNLHNRTKSIPLKILTNEEDDEFEDSSNPNSPTNINISMTPKTPQSATGFLPIYNNQEVIKNTHPSKSLIIPYSNGSFNDRYYSSNNSSIEGMIDHNSVGVSEINERDFYKDFQKKLDRRMTIPNLVGDLNLKCLQYDYEPIENIIFKEKKRNDFQRPRSQSMTQLDSHFLTWSKPFEIPIETLSTNFLKAKIQYLRTTKTFSAKSFALANENEESIGSVSSSNSISSLTNDLSIQPIQSPGLSFLSLNNSINISCSVNSKFRQFVEYLQYCQNTVFKKFDYLGNNTTTIFQFQQLYLNKSKEMESLVSKLKYEVQILRIRIRDVDDAVKELGEKMEGLKDSGLLNDSE